MEPEQDHESAHDAGAASSTEQVSPSHPFISRIAKLMGKTAGLAQTTGVKTADGLLAAGRRAGKLLSVPSMLRSLVAHDTEKKREAEVHREIEYLESRISELYKRIGEEVCHSPKVARSFLPADPQLEALISTVRDLEAESRELEQHAQGVPPIPLAPEREGTASAVESTGPPIVDLPADAAPPSPVAEEHKEPPFGTV